MKYLSLFKNEKATDKQPQYFLTSSRQDENGEWKNFRVGVGWVKQTKDGRKFISIKLQDVYQEYPGFKLVEEPAQPVQPAPAPQQPAPAQNNAVQTVDNNPTVATNTEVTIPPAQAQEEEINVEDIPF